MVPTFRRFEPLLQTLDDLLQQDYPSFEVIVADQNQAWPHELDARREALSADPRVRWLVIDTPGVVRARNRAVAASSGAILLFVDDDVRIPHRLLLRAHAELFEGGTIAAVVGRERQVGDVIGWEPSGAAPGDPLPEPVALSPLQQALSFNRNGDQAQYVCTFSTCNGSVLRSAFLSVGGFDELFAGNSYGDDYDLALRLHRSGARMVYEPAAWLIHCRAPIGGLRLSDPANKPAAVATAQGLWLFVLRHGHRGMYGTLIVNHVLRKTILLKQNLQRPWREPRVMFQTLLALPLAYRKLAGGPQSLFGQQRVIQA